MRASRAKRWRWSDESSSRMQDFHSDCSSRVVLFGFVDRTHAPLAETANDAVTGQDRRVPGSGKEGGLLASEFLTERLRRLSKLIRIILDHPRRAVRGSEPRDQGVLHCEPVHTVAAIRTIIQMR